jgi:hypothetical protein
MPKKNSKTPPPAQDLLRPLALLSLLVLIIALIVTDKASEALLLGIAGLIASLVKPTEK